MNNFTFSRFLLKIIYKYFLNPSRANKNTAINRFKFSIINRKTVTKNRHFSLAS